MNKTIILLASAAATALSSGAFATETKRLSDSIVSIDGLPAGSYKSTSIVAYGEPPKAKPEMKRRFEVGFLPKIPPAPNAEEEAMVDDKAMPADAAEKTMKADMGDSGTEGAASSEKTASIEGGEGGENDVTQINLDGMELRTN